MLIGNRPWRSPRIERFLYGTWAGEQTGTAKVGSLAMSGTRRDLTQPDPNAHRYITLHRPILAGRPAGCQATRVLQSALAPRNVRKLVELRLHPGVILPPVIVQRMRYNLGDLLFRQSGVSGLHLGCVF